MLIYTNDVNWKPHKAETEGKDTNYFVIKERKLEKNLEYSVKVPIFAPSEHLF